MLRKSRSPGETTPDPVSSNYLAVAVTFSLMTSAFACHNPFVPSDGEDAVYVLAAGQEIIVVSPQAGVVVSRFGRVPDFKDGIALFPDSDAVLLSGLDDGADQRVILAIDLAREKILWRESVADIADRSDIGPIAIGGERNVAVSSDGTSLLVASAVQNGVVGVVILDADSRDPIGFIGPLVLGREGATILPSGEVWPSSRLILAGRRSVDSPRTDWLFVLDPTATNIVDSAHVTTPDGNALNISHMVAAPDGRHVYLAGNSLVSRFDFVTGTVVATQPSPARGWLTIGARGEKLYMTDAGDGRDFPGTGLLYVYDASLGTLETIDLQHPDFNGAPPVAIKAAESKAGDLLYVLSGTARRGPLFGVQPGRLMIVNLSTRRVTGLILLDVWSPRDLLVR